MHFVYLPNIAPVVQLSQEESGHAVRVLRLAFGDKVIVSDGKGTLHEASIIDPHPKRCILQIEKELPWQKGWDFRLHLAFAPTKNMDRIEWAMEKATELGIDEFTPLLCRHSERKELKMPRLEKLLISSIKQSQKALIPTLNPMTPFDTFVSSVSTPLYIAHCHEGEKTHLAKALIPHQPVTLLVGPEGDFHVDEVKTALNLGAKPISLGTERLRTETAMLYACTIAHTLNQL